MTVERDNAGSRLVIAPGLAFDPHGNEIYVDQPVALPLSTQGAALFVLLHYVERPCRHVPVMSSDPLDTTDGVSSTQPSRVAETFSAEVAPTLAVDAVAIARLRQVRGRWRSDSTFDAGRAR